MPNLDRFNDEAWHYHENRHRAEPKRKDDEEPECKYCGRPLNLYECHTGVCKLCRKEERNNERS